MSFFQEWCFGSWVHMLPLFSNASLIHFKILKYSELKSKCTSSHAKCANNISMKTWLVVWIYVKKTNFGAKNKTFVRHVFVFSHWLQKLSAFCENVRAHINCWDVHAYILFELLIVINIFNWISAFFHNINYILLH
jgi:hypothetical protein